MATVKDIAKLAGVSTATVSRALSTPEKVTDSTRRKVEQAARAAGYAPNAMARSLRRNESRTIVVVVPNLSNSFFTEIINGMEAYAHRRGYTILIGDAGHESARVEGYFERVASRQADGIVCLTADVPRSLIFDDEGHPRFPLIMACEHFRGTTVPSVNIDNAYSAEKAVEYLVLMGHYKIATMTGPSENPISAARLAGFEKVLRKHNLTFPAEWCLEGDFRFHSGYSLGRQLLSSENRPTAVFCQSDEMAIGLLKAAKELNIRVPDALSIVGFDNIEITEYTDPMLTTVHQPRRLIGETAIKQLLEILAGKRPNPEMTLPTQLILRDSSAPPPPELRLKRDL